MGDGSRFEKLLNRLPMDNDKLIGQAVAWFIANQEPDGVNFTGYKNGYKIEVRTDKENANEAQEFWKENVHPYMTGDD